MTIDNNCGQEEGMQNYPGSQAEAHSQIALEQSALYAARLAIARWMNTSAEPPAPIAPAASRARAAWYAQAQDHFQEWLGNGGFAQYDVAPAELVEAVSWAPAGTDAAAPLAQSSSRPAPTCID